MGINRGKQFETVVKDCFQKIDNLTIYRLYDTTNGFSGVANISDFIIYQKPVMLFLECKSVHGKSFPLSNLTDTQYSGMLHHAETNGVKCGVLIWFIDIDKTYYINIQEIKRIKEQGKKSISEKDLLNDLCVSFLIKGNKKRVFFDYDFVPLMDYLKS